MIFAHGPLGFLIASAFHKRARKAPFNLTDRQWYAVLAAGFIGGIFPDVDLFFYYFVNAETSHREFITHTPFFYICLFVVAALIAKIAKSPKLFFGSAIFTLGTFSHLITDSVAAKILFLYPWQNTLYGVQNLHIPALNGSILAINFLMEGIIFFFFFYALIKWNVRTRSRQIVAIAALVMVFASGVLTVVIGNNHIYHDSSDTHYGDIDNDGNPNYTDPDIDGDGMSNIADLDADNDGKSNAHEIIENAERFEGVWYDPTEGGLAQIPARLGLITNRDIIWRLFESVGINIQTEMVQDFAKNPDGYLLTPADENFDRDIQNITVWLEHAGRFQKDPSQSRDHIGDILFFANDVVAIVTGFTNTAQTVVLDVSPHRPVAEKTLTEFIVLQGPVQARGVMIDSAPLYPNGSQ